MKWIKSNDKLQEKKKKKLQIKKIFSQCTILYINKYTWSVNKSVYKSYLKQHFVHWLDTVGSHPYIMTVNICKWLLTLEGIIKPVFFFFGKLIEGVDTQASTKTPCRQLLSKRLFLKYISIWGKNIKESRQLRAIPFSLRRCHRIQYLHISAT